MTKNSKRYTVNPCTTNTQVTEFCRDHKIQSLVHKFTVKDCMTISSFKLIMENISRYNYSLTDNYSLKKSCLKCICDNVCTVSH